MKITDQLLSQGNTFFRYRSFIPLLLLPFAFWACAVSIYHHPDWFTHEGITFPEKMAIVLCLIGFLIRVITVGFTPANTSGRNTVTQVADSLNTKGIYSTVRHHLYLGNFFIQAGFRQKNAICVGSRGKTIRHRYPCPCGHLPE